MQHGNGLMALVAVGLMVLTSFATLTTVGGEGSVPAPASRGLPNDQDSEPNNDMVNATNITGPLNTMPGQLAGSDVNDWFRVKLTNGGGNADLVKFEVWWNATLGYSARVYDPYGFTLEFSRDSQVMTFYALGAINSMYYYLRLTNDFGSGMNFAYTLNVTFNTAAYTSDGDNDPDNATVVSTFPYTKSDSTDGDDNPTDYEDFYKVNVAASPTAKDLLTVHMAPSANLAQWVQLFAQNGSKWDPVSSSATKEDPAQKGTNQTVTYAAKATGTILIRLWNTNTTGTYSIWMNKISIAIKDCNYANATLLQFDTGSLHTGIGNGSLGEGIHSCDWYKFTANKDQYMYVAITSKSYDTTIKLPKIYGGLFNLDGTTEYSYDPNKNDPSLDPYGYMNASATEDNKNNYVKIEVIPGGGAGEYNFTFITDKRPVNKTSSVKPINIPENGNDSTIQIKYIFSDPENDTLAFDWWIDSTEGMDDTGNFTVTIGTDALMTVKLKPKEGTPFGWKGAGKFCVRATDTYGLNDTVCWAVTVIGENHLPYMTNETIDPVVLKLDDEPQYRTNETINLNNYFSDWDNEKLHFTMKGQGVNLSFKRVGVNNYLANATITVGSDPVLKVIFSLETNGWQHSGLLRIMPTDEAIAKAWTGEVVVTFYALDVADLESEAGLNVTIKVSKKEGTAPNWQTFDLKWDEDLVLEKDFLVEKLLTDMDLTDDKITFSFIPAAPENITIEQVAGECDGVTKCKYRFIPKENWYGEEPIIINATDSYGKSSETKDLKLEVMSVDDAPVINKTYPSTSQKNVNEGETVTFVIDVTDVDTPLSDLKYEWRFEGDSQKSVTGPEYTWTPDAHASRAQPYNVNVKVTYAGWGGSLNMSWEITVMNVNMPPKIGKILKPTMNQSFPKGTVIDLSCEAATDPDGDNLTYKWYVDGADVLDRGTAVTYDTSELEPGIHTVKLEVSDGVTLISPYTNVTINITEAEKKSKKGGLPGFGATLVVGAVLVAVAVAALGARRRKEE